MNPQKAEHWLRHFAAETPEGERTRTEAAGVALLPELAKLRKARATINEQSNTIAELQAELKEEKRLSGMGSEREAAKDARIAELEAELARLISRGTTSAGCMRIKGMFAEAAQQKEGGA